MCHMAKVFWVIDYIEHRFERQDALTWKITVSLDTDLQMVSARGDLARQPLLIHSTNNTRIFWISVFAGGSESAAARTLGSRQID